MFYENQQSYNLANRQNTSELSAIDAREKVTLTPPPKTDFWPLIATYINSWPKVTSRSPPFYRFSATKNSGVGSGTFLRKARLS
jgi:hypothetical protein